MLAQSEQGETMTKDETLKMALEALEADPLEMVADVDGHMVFLKDKAITVIKEALAQPEQNQFKPDWDAMAVMVEEQQRMSKRIEDLETEQDCVGWFGYDTGLRLWFETNKGDDGAIPLYKRRRTHD